MMMQLAQRCMQLAQRLVQESQQQWLMII
jgi:hypothetical protein